MQALPAGVDELHAPLHTYRAHGGGSAGAVTCQKTKDSLWVEGMHLSPCTFLVPICFSVSHVLPRCSYCTFDFLRAHPFLAAGVASRIYRIASHFLEHAVGSSYGRAWLVLKRTV